MSKYREFDYLLKSELIDDACNLTKKEKENIMNKEQTIEETKEHKRTVAKYIDVTIQELIGRGIDHDNSKLEDFEVDIFAEFTPKLKNTTYGSDEYKNYLKEMGVALEHHYKNNRHHPEHFENSIKGMDLIDLVEMICDWKSATLRHADGDIIKSVEMNQERFGYSDELKQILLNTVKNYM